jgi:Flp pilus assembly protein TadG
MAFESSVRHVGGVLRRVITAAGRLAKDQRGNALIITAAAIIPIMACIGGGLDISRAYLVKSRLNEACDAASLAGRRAMTNEDITTATPEATKFFNFNFPQNYMGTSSFTPNITHPDTGVVRVTASTTTPTTLMKLFGYGSIPVSVTCDATQNFDNIDVLLVLDTTGSMAYDMAGNFKGDSNSASKMYGLRQAVLALFDQLKPAQDQLAAQGLRLRYGIVPYSSAVNVGKLVYAQNSSYMISGNYTYQSRYPNWTTNKKGQTVFGSWTYAPVSYNISNFVAGNSLTTPTGTNGANVTFNWGGCIEERQTTSSITGSSSTTSIPSNAYDLNIDLIPSSNADKWRPYLADTYANGYTTAEYDRTNSSSGSSPQEACPQQAARLTTWDRTSLQNYVNSMYSDGGTYHDLGMIWGARFLSPNGIFGSDNPTTYNSRPVHTYIIYMTDGILDTGSTLYSSYGIEHLDVRVTGGFISKSDQDARHRTRFLMACNAAKSMGASIWTIVFATADDATMQTCATNSDQYALSKNSTDLINKFKEIGKNIGALRLSQ